MAKLRPIVHDVNGGASVAAPESSPDAVSSDNVLETLKGTVAQCRLELEASATRIHGAKQAHAEADQRAEREPSASTFDELHRAVTSLAMAHRQHAVRAEALARAESELAAAENHVVTLREKAAADAMVSALRDQASLSSLTRDTEDIASELYDLLFRRAPLLAKEFDDRVRVAKSAELELAKRGEVVSPLDVGHCTFAAIARAVMVDDASLARGYIAHLDEVKHRFSGGLEAAFILPLRAILAGTGQTSPPELVDTERARLEALVDGRTRHEGRAIDTELRNRAGGAR